MGTLMTRQTEIMDTLGKILPRFVVDGVVLGLVLERLAATSMLTRYAGNE